MGDRRKDNIPERVYLQVYGENDPYDAEDLRGKIEWREVSWSAERIWDSDVEYVLVKRRKRGR